MYLKIIVLFLGNLHKKKSCAGYVGHPFRKWAHYADVPNSDCGGRKFHSRQEVTKALRDTVYHAVQVHRYECLRRQRTFRVYLEGTTRAQTGASRERAGGDAVSAEVGLWGCLLGLRGAWDRSKPHSSLIRSNVPRKPPHRTACARLILGWKAVCGW